MVRYRRVLLADKRSFRSSIIPTMLAAIQLCPALNTVNKADKATSPRPRRLAYPISRSSRDLRGRRHRHGCIHFCSPHSYWLLSVPSLFWPVAAFYYRYPAWHHRPPHLPPPTSWWSLNCCQRFSGNGSRCGTFDNTSLLLFDFWRCGRRLNNRDVRIRRDQNTSRANRYW